MRRGGVSISNIITFTGIHMDPMNPHSEELCIEDIAHALSMMCRANGHFHTFYSVAQHSINCYREAAARGYSKKVQLACLLHDASEAYLSDVTRPVKQHLDGYREVEGLLQDMIYAKWLSEPLDEVEAMLVKQVDDALLYYEFLYYMNVRILSYDPVIFSKPLFYFESIDSVKKQFINHYNHFSCNHNGSVTVGVDGYKGKWMAVVCENNDMDYKIFDRISDVCNTYDEADNILIDMPIGLPESKEEIKNRPDRLLAKKLIGKSSSVFNTPLRQITMASTLSEKWDINRAYDAKMQPVGMAITNSIRQVDEFLQNNPGWKNRLQESHPEYAFQILNGDSPLKYGKRTAQGQQERIATLSRYNDGINKLIKKYLTDAPNRKKTDDLLDAACLAITGQLGMSNGFTSIPEIPYTDRTGLKMQIVCANI